MIGRLSESSRWLVLAEVVMFAGGVAYLEASIRHPRLVDLPLRAAWCSDQEPLDLVFFDLALNGEAKLNPRDLGGDDLCLVEHEGLVHAGPHRYGADALCPLFLAASGIGRRYGVEVRTLRISPTPDWLAQCRSREHGGVLHAAIDGLGHLRPLSLVAGGVTVSTASPPRAAEYDSAVVRWPELLFGDAFRTTGFGFVSLQPFGNGG